MGLRDYLQRFLSAGKPQVRALPPVSVRALPGGRASVDSVNMLPASNWLVVPPSSHEANWQLLNLSSKDFDQIDPAQLLEVLADLSPEVSRALWDALRMMNPGWKAKAMQLKGDKQDTRAQAALDDFINRMSDYHGTFDVVVGRLYLGAFLRGALCGELVLDRRGRMPLDIATPDAASVRFRKRTDPERGEVWQAGQWQAYQFKPLDIPTFRYVPIDPMPGSPYGRPMAAPALFTSLFLLGMMHDLRRVIQQQGYPRLDVKIDIEQLIKAAPQLATDTTKFNDFVAALVAEVETVYSSLQPDDAYIHTSNISQEVVGAASGNHLAGIDAVITALERMSVRALKTMPLLMGISDAVGDVQSNRMWEIHVAGIKSIQHYCETVLERLFGLALQAQGIQARVQFRFAELRAAERFRDAQTEAMEIANEISKRDQGWQSQDEASVAITGSPAVAPAPSAAAPTPEIVQGSTDGMQLNAQAILQIREARAEVAKAIETINLNGYHARN